MNSGKKWRGWRAVAFGLEIAARQSLQLTSQPSEAALSHPTQVLVGC